MAWNILQVYFFTESDVHIFYVRPSLIFGGMAKEPTLGGMIQSSPQILAYDKRAEHSSL